MINSVKAIFRQTMQRPVLSFMNLLGLAGGVATCILIFLYAHSELNYDIWVPNQDNLYRVEGQFVQSSTAFVTSSMAPLKAELLVDGSSFKDVVRKDTNQWPVQLDNFVNYEDVDVVDENFLDIFPLTFVSGSKDTAFGNQNNVIINETMAKKYFGDIDPIGKTLTINGDLKYSVSGIFKDVPLRSDVRVRILIPSNTTLFRNYESWNNVSLETFVTLKDGANLEDAHAQLTQLVEKHRPFTGDSPGEMKDIYRMFLQPFGDIHLGSRGRTGADSMGNFGMIYGFVGIAILILFISAFNYVSLSTARALEREKEICLRKVMGAKRTQIVKQVMTESIGQTALAAFLALMVVENALPFFGQAVNQTFNQSDLFNPTTISLFIAGTIVLGMLSGLYPALFVSGFRPIRYLSSGKAQRAGLNRLRTSLVFIQFTVCIGLIIGAFAISKQINHINSVDVGFNQDNLLIVRGVNRKDTISQAKTLKQVVANIPGVEAVTRSSIVPLDGSTSMEGFYNRNITRDESVTIRDIIIDYDFFSAYGNKIIAGRGLSEQFSNDGVILDSYATWTQDVGVGNVVLSREAVRILGYSSPEEALGEQIQLYTEGGGGQPLIIVGVTEDMQFRSSRSNNQAILYHYDPNSLRALTVRASAGATSKVVEDLGQVWADMFPNTPILMEFMEETIESQYQTESQQLGLFIFFAGLALLLSLIGLIGLVMNSVSHRTKEISIRRVVGASVGDIIKLFTWDYLKPVLFANVPAGLLAWYFLGNWIERYAQRVTMGPDLYIFAGGTILACTIIVVGVLVTRTALTPPVHALRAD